MWKLKIPQKAIELHKNYFMYAVVKSIKNAEVDKNNEYEVKVHDFLNQIISAQDTNNSNEKITCEDIAVGDYEKLRLFDSKIYSIIKDLNKENGCSENNEYSSFLNSVLKWFGYEEFSSLSNVNNVSRSIYHYIEDLYGDGRYDAQGNYYGWKHPADMKKWLQNWLNSKGIELKNYTKKYFEEWLVEVVFNDITIENYKGSLLEKIGMWTPTVLNILLNIKVCPYCNRQYITPIIINGKQLRGDLDHFIPKSRHPWLSMSLYNLVPCCHICNSRLKSNTEITFSDLAPYRDNVASQFKYVYDEIEGTIEAKAIDNTNLKIKKYLSLYKINETLKYHTDIPRKIFLRLQAYPYGYVQGLINQRIISEADRKSIYNDIIGCPLDEKDIDQEILGKLKKDMERQFRKLLDAEADSYHDEIDARADLK